MISRAPTLSSIGPTRGRPSRVIETVAGAHRAMTSGVSSPHSVWLSGSAVSFSDTTFVARLRSGQVLALGSTTADRTPPSASVPPKSDRAVVKYVDMSDPNVIRPPVPSTAGPAKNGCAGSVMLTR